MGCDVLPSQASVCIPNWQMHTHVLPGPGTCICSTQRGPLKACMLPSAADDLTCVMWMREPGPDGEFKSCIIPSCASSIRKMHVMQDVTHKAVGQSQAINDQSCRVITLIDGKLDSSAKAELLTPASIPIELQIEMGNREAPYRLQIACWQSANSTQDVISADSCDIAGNSTSFSIPPFAPPQRIYNAIYAGCCWAFDKGFCLFVWIQRSVLA